jgi:hypothetical protein
MTGESLRWLFVGLLLVTLTACNSGQCLRQSDCPLGSTCKSGMCRIPATSKPAATTSSDSSSLSSSTTSAASQTSFETFPDDAGDGTSSEQSSNLDAASDTSSTVAP